MTNSTEHYGASQTRSHSQNFISTEHRLTAVEQGLIHMQSFLNWRRQTVDTELARLTGEIDGLKEDQREIYRHAWRIVWTIGGGAALVIFNVIWERGV